MDCRAHRNQRAGLPAHEWWTNHSSRAQFDPYATGELSGWCARGRPVPRTVERRRFHLWRQWHGKPWPGGEHPHPLSRQVRQHRPYTAPVGHAGLRKNIVIRILLTGELYTIGWFVIFHMRMRTTPF